MPALLPKECLVEGEEIKYNNLIEVISQGNCIVFVGSGVSVNAGYPSWDNLVDDLLKKASLSRDHPALKSIKKLDKGEQFPLYIEQCKKVMKPPKYYDNIRKIFEPVGKKDLYAPIHQHLIEMPFKGIVTTNIDNCLQEAVPYSNMKKDVDSCIRINPNLNPEDLAGRKKIFHLHGRCGAGDEMKTIVLASSEYRHEYRKGSILRRFITHCLLYHHCLFIGYSMIDPFLNRIIVEAKELKNSVMRDSKRSGQQVSEYLHCVFLADKAFHLEEQRIMDKKLIIGAQNYKYKVISLDQLPKELEMVEIHYRFDEQHTALKHLTAQMDMSIGNISQVEQ